MTHHLKSTSAGLCALALMAFAGAAPGYALTAKECSTKYNAAKTAGTLGTTTWNDFRKTQCADAKPADAAPAAATAKPVVKPAAAPPATTTGAVFPKSVDAKYAKESAGKARMHTCRDQYQANKTSNGNGGLKWIQKGGGYYSECNKSLKS